jgi:plasmid maintenance system antidote protein VapI
VPRKRISEIVSGWCVVSAESAWLLAGAFGTTPEFWTNLLQARHELAGSKPVRRIERLRRNG